ncbi:pullulanase/glycogen debranching enzyme [Chitinivorax tropicus]|uniref:pullulanase n=1 Tax=Chitinivorax tropicus TaxID=714531 RepID=A0A840MKF6_9PROT|nr:pullulanase-type alpha-1,6-glucosidase [Chitinivorax tropicus]MBB5017985.1 pullulanase/glycogen debranching enzyme [Chitinivorax tropicus]
MVSTHHLLMQVRPLVAAVALAVGLAGCGGSGSSDGGGSTPPPTQGTATPIAAATMRVHFHRNDGNTADWGVYSWSGPKEPKTSWPQDRIKFTGQDAFGAYVDIPLDVSKSKLEFLVIDGNGNKSCGSDQHAPFASDIATKGQEVWLLEGDCKVYDKQPAFSVGSFANAGAMWLNQTTIAWPGASAGNTYKLYYAAQGGIKATPDGVSGADGEVTLQMVAAGLPDALRQQFPHLAGTTALMISGQDAATDTLKGRLKGQVVIAESNAAGKVIKATSLQTAGVLDSLYANTARTQTLGLSFDANQIPTFALWAPTAKSVKLNVYPENGAPVTVDMVEDRNTGVWRHQAKDASWTNAAYYTYTVEVFSRWADNQVAHNTVTDPYSVSVSANGQKSFVGNLDATALKPTGWDGHAVPALAAPEDISLYELHVRDFSATDTSQPANLRGKYLAFTNTNSNGVKHLRGLQQAGLTHIHLLPVFDIATIDEQGCTETTIPDAPADSDQQQAAVQANKAKDCFNWGYDPHHYNAPEGSYATDVNDAKTRVREFRQMVKALHEQGLRVVMDVVYNHTAEAGQGDKSVLDKIVPGYYYRLDNQGSIFNSTCCSNTAAEHVMMAKLMIDSTKQWAKAYQIDGFRFDIMGHHPLDVINRLKSETDTAAGRELYYYGEAWNFGEVANDQRFKQARQDNMAGTGIGSFNDRLRDAVRGGGCCDSGEALLKSQGYANGIYLDGNGHSSEGKDALLHQADLVKLGLAGTLKDYVLVDKDGKTKRGNELSYFDLKAGYAGDPQETINYVEAHDNQTLFDINAFKLPVGTSKADRVRSQILGSAIVTLSQGIPFYHAGQDILRSKALDRDSYNSGDWFNQLDWTYTNNHFAIGLPVAEKNQENWSLIKPLLTNPLLQMGKDEIETARDVFRDFMTIRQSSTLFRLRTGDDVKNRLSFFNVGPDQVPGVIVAHLDGVGYAGANFKRIVTVVNPDKTARAVGADALKGKLLALHPVQSGGRDPLVKTAKFDAAAGVFNIPARTVAVFVEN